jgi:hypothetical protein
MGIQKRSALHRMRKHRWRELDPWSWIPVPCGALGGPGSAAPERWSDTASLSRGSFTRAAEWAATGDVTLPVKSAAPERDMAPGTMRSENGSARAVAHRASTRKAWTLWSSRPRAWGGMRCPRIAGAASSRRSLSRHVVFSQDHGSDGDRSPSERSASCVHRTA